MRVRVTTLVAIALSFVVAHDSVAQLVGRAAAKSSVRGVVFDSVRGKPLGDALVTIDGKSTTTDSRGRFRFDSVARGTRTISVAHATLDTLGFFGLSRQANVSDSGAEIRVGIPSFATLWRNGCGKSKPPADSGIVYGVIRDARTQQPISAVRVQLVWSELALRSVSTSGEHAPQLVERRWTSDTHSVTDGTYAFCGVPPHAILRIQASTDSAATGAVAFETGDLRVHRQDLVVGAKHLRSGLIVGFLSDASGDPFIDARVSLDDSVERRSEFDGRFVFANVPAGTHQLVARYIGAAPVAVTIDVAIADTTPVAMTMSKVVRLTTMNTTSPEHARMLLESYQARQIMYHRFMLDSNFVGRQNTMENVFQTFPNVTVKQHGIGEFTLLVPDRHNGSCVPELRIDGVLANEFGQLASVPTSRVAAVEVYPFASEIPPELQRGGIRYECGMVAVWTKWAFRPR